MTGRLATDILGDFPTFSLGRDGQQKLTDLPIFRFEIPGKGVQFVYGNDVYVEPT